ncbi:MAG TPA: DUF1906 domain-containing protein [Trebonia sp.]|nr:DUF1906 domain-containing protein [Trebonia sp.]
MRVQGPRASAEVRRRYFAFAAVGAMGLVFSLAIVLPLRASGHPAAHGSASPAVTARGTAGAVPSRDSEAAKLAAEANGATNPVTDTSAAQILPQQPSWNAAPKVVRYHGYQFRVPGSWPVYNLATHPSQCVLFSTHAVYLGTPGNAQRCPASAVGRTEALLIQPLNSATIQASAIKLNGGSAALPERAALPAAAAADHMFQVEVPGAGVLVTATYGTQEPRLRSVLAGATIVGQAAAPGARSRSPGPSGSGSSALGGSAAPGASSAAKQSVMTVAADSLTSSVTSAPASPLTSMVGSGLGMDTCTAPSISTMTAWLASPYRVIGTYLGGMNWACDYGNFSATWVQRVAAEGWRFAPLWVGRQAPCVTIQGIAVIDPSHAVAEGESEAESAVAAARRFGFGQGTPIYFDMEGYQPTRGCTSAVVNFLGGWTRELHAAGYLSGFYSSAASGIKDLAAAYNKSGYPRPDDIWIAFWNGEPVLTNPYVPNAYWANHQRLHQYSGPHDEKWGGATLDIDADAVDGQVVGMPAVPDLPRPAESALPSELTVAPGKAVSVKMTLHGVPRTPVDVQWRVGTPRGMSAKPGYGTVYLWPGALYSVTISLQTAANLAPGRYVVPIAVTSGSHAVTDAFVLVSVVSPGKWLPTRYPVVLYAADATDIATAAQVSRELALPPGDVTGSFSQAWKDTSSGKDLVLAVGQAAANALYFNFCGWTNPAGWPAGSTPFYYPGYPLRNLPGRDYFELASTSTTAGTTLLATQLAQYALGGPLPNYGSEPVAATPPTLRCLGAPNVGVP